MTAEAWALEDVRRRLTATGEQGEMLSLATLREEVGIGHDDLSDVLDALREAGDAVEGAPGEWRPPYDDERDARAGASTEADDEDDEDDADAAARRALARRDRPARERTPATEGAPATGAGLLAGGTGTVVLTQKVAGALSSETIGELVKAGISEAEDGARAFVLRVEPSSDASG